jgi:FdhD protein
MGSDYRILRYTTEAGAENARDELSVEEPLEIRINNRAVSVTMRTPGHDEELAAGFLFTEGMIHSRDDIVSIAPCVSAREGNVVNVTPSPSAKIDFDKLTRHVFASSSCGLCGKATIESIHCRFGPVDSSVRVGAKMLLALPQKLRQAQSTFARTGGLHGAALFTATGELVVAREDVGRHNAVDKVLGYGLLNDRLPFDQQLLLVSGRASFEIMQKALAARVPIVAAVSAPSSLAVDFAAESQMTLVGFLRDGRMNIYTEPSRIEFSNH